MGIPVDAATEWDMIRIAGSPDHGTMTGVFSIIENQVAEVLLYGLGGQFPSVEADQYEKQCRELVSPKIAEVVLRLEPMTAPRGYHAPELTNQRYDDGALASWLVDFRRCLLQFRSHFWARYYRGGHILHDIPVSPFEKLRALTEEILDK